MSGELGTKNLEKLKGTHLDEDAQDELLTTQTECSFIFSTAEGWPTGVIMSFIHVDGKFWLDRRRGPAPREGRRPRRAGLDHRLQRRRGSPGAG